VQWRRPEEIARRADEAANARALRLCDELLLALQRYPRRDEAIVALERHIADERRHLFGGSTSRTRD
jgi:hypothetical protein